MKDLVLRLFIRIGALKSESGQDMVEYAIIMGLIALGATAAMSGVATSIAAAFTSVTTSVGTYAT